MDFSKQYFTSDFISTLSKKVFLELGITTIDEREGAVSLEQLVEPKNAFIIEGVKGKKNTSTQVVLKLKHNKMILTRNFEAGHLMANMGSLGFDNSIENFRENAETLITFADFKDLAEDTLKELN